MSRLLIDHEKYRKEYAKFPKPDGVHCIICGKVLLGRKRKYCSQECFSNWYLSLNHTWESVRKKVIERDKKCVDCGKEYVENYSYGKFAVHHVIPIQHGGEEFDVNNCVLLCLGCHKLKHRKKYFDGSQRNLEYFK